MRDPLPSFSFLSPSTSSFSSSSSFLLHLFPLLPSGQRANLSILDPGYNCTNETVATLNRLVRRAKETSPSRDGILAGYIFHGLDEFSCFVATWKRGRTRGEVICYEGGETFNR